MMQRLWVVLLIGALSSGLAQQNMALLYDSKIPKAALNLSTSERQKIASEVIGFTRAALRQSCSKASHWNGQTGTLEARMTGSFTRRSSQQTLYVVNIPCFAEQSDDTWRVAAVYEGAKLVKAYLLLGFLPIGAITEVYAVRDVNQNGFSEVAVVSSWADGLGGRIYLDLIDWNGKAPQPLGSVGVTWTDFSRTSPEGQPDLHEYIVYVAKGPRPVFVGLEAGSTTRLSLLPLEKPRVVVRPIR